MKRLNVHLLKRLEEIEKRMVPKNIDVMVFIEESVVEGSYQVQQNVYRGNGTVCIDKWNIKASSAQEVADQYQPPEGCKEPMIFMYDFGEGRKQ